MVAKAAANPAMVATSAYASDDEEEEVIRRICARSSPRGKKSRPIMSAEHKPSTTDLKSV